MTRRATLCSFALAALVAIGPAVAARIAPAAWQAPVLVMATEKGEITIELFPADAPKSVEHILALVKRNFYRGLRFHRVTASLAQFGDPGTRDMSRVDYWGSGGSGNPIGIAEFSKRLTHVRGTVALAHSGSPLAADSQLYIMKTASPSLNGKHVIVGRVTGGMAVVDKIVKTDRIVSLSLKAEGHQ